jgi:hypothetical protein
VAVVLNLEPVAKSVRFEEPLSGRIELSTDPGRAHERVGERVELAADEGVIIVPA